MPSLATRDEGARLVRRGETRSEMRAAGVHLVTTTDDLVDRVRAREVRLVTCHPACGGLPADPSRASLRLMCETVLPAVRGG